MLRLSMFLLLTGCMYSSVTGDPGSPDIGEYQNCEVVLHCPSENYESKEHKCTQDTDVLENELEYYCREAAVANGCPVTSYCTATCTGTSVACVFVPDDNQ